MMKGVELEKNFTLPKEISTSWDCCDAKHARVWWSSHGHGPPREGAAQRWNHWGIKTQVWPAGNLGGDEAALPRTPARGPITNNHRIGTDVKQMRSFPTIPVN